MIEAILTSAVPALLPALSDGVRGIFNKVTGNAGAKPANVNEVIQLGKLSIDRMKTLAQLDNATGASQWVINIRAIQRPLYGALILGGYVGGIVFGADEAVTLQLGQYAQMVTFYIFGDVAYGNVKGA